MNIVHNKNNNKKYNKKQKIIFIAAIAFIIAAIVLCILLINNIHNISTPKNKNNVTDNNSSNPEDKISNTNNINGKEQINSKMKNLYNKFGVKDIVYTSDIDKYNQNIAATISKLYDIPLKNKNLVTEIQTKTSIINNALNKNATENNAFNERIINGVVKYCSTNIEPGTDTFVQVNDLKAADWLKIINYWLYNTPNKNFNWTEQASYNKIYYNIVKKEIYKEKFNNISNILILNDTSKLTMDNNNINIEMVFTNNNINYIAYFSNDGNNFTLLDINKQ